MVNGTGQGEIFGPQADLPTTAGATHKEDAGESVAKAAMFFAGLKILQTLNLCFAGSFPTLLRFGIPPKQIGPFIGVAGACLQACAVFGLILGFSIGLTNTGAYFITAGYSILTTIFLFLIHIKLLRVCLYSHGYDGVRNYFFWLCASGFVYQTDSMLCPATWGWQANFFFLGMEVTNVLIPIVHFIAWLFFQCCGGQDIVTTKLVWQLRAMVVFTFLCVVVWILCFFRNIFNKGCNANAQYAGEAGSSDSNSCHAKNHSGTNDFKGAFGITDDNDATATSTGNTGIRCNRHAHTQAALNCREIIRPSGTGSIVVSPFFMGVLGMGSIFWLFPVIFPFMVCHFSHFESTQKWLLVLGAIATLIVWGINDGVKLYDNTTWFGMNFHNWSDGPLWNLSWLLLLPVGFLTWMFFNCLHSPRGFFGRSLLHSKWAVVWGCVFFFLSQLFKAFGLNGVFMNAIITAKIGPLGNVSFMLSMIHLVASLFTAQAYSDGYSSFKNAVNSGCPWPTQGVGGFRSFCWWLGYGLKNGNRRFWSLADVDIIQVIS